MEKIIVSINPEYVEKILSGEKKFEYRTKIAKLQVDTLIIYATKPMMKVVAEAEILGFISTSPEELWNQTKNQSGITKSFFDEYFKDKRVAYSYKLGEVKMYERPKSLLDFGLRMAPQSFAYVK